MAGHQGNNRLMVGCSDALLQVKAVYMPLKDPAWR
jgi:hypothetical protein